MEKMLLAGLLTVAQAGSDDCALRAAFIDKDYDSVKACFIQQARPLIEASQEPAETVATAVDALCRGAKIRFVQRFAPCMRRDGAQDLINKIAADFRGAIIATIVTRRAATPPRAGAAGDGAAKHP